MLFVAGESGDFNQVSSCHKKTELQVWYNIFPIIVAKINGEVKIIDCVGRNCLPLEIRVENITKCEKKIVKVTFCFTRICLLKLLHPCWLTDLHQCWPATLTEEPHGTRGPLDIFGLCVKNPFAVQRTLHRGRAWFHCVVFTIIQPAKQEMYLYYICTFKSQLWHCTTRTASTLQQLKKCRDLVKFNKITQNYDFYSLKVIKVKVEFYLLPSYLLLKR